MPALESFLMHKHLPIMEVGQELPLTPFQIGVHPFFLPTLPAPMLSSALSIKHPNPACLTSTWGAGSVGGPYRGKNEVPVSNRRFLSPVGLVFGSDPKPTMRSSF